MCRQSAVEKVQRFRGTHVWEHTRFFTRCRCRVAELQQVQVPVKWLQRCRGADLLSRCRVRCRFD